MKQYLKMADYFVGGASARLNHYGDVVVDYDCADPDMIVKKTMLAIEQAINSHDELVQMNKELLKALEEGRRAIGEHFAPNDCYATGPLTGDDFRDLVECPACSFIAMYDSVIAKAKGGAE